MRGIAYKMFGIFALAVMAAIIKGLSQRYPLNEIVFARSAFMLLPVLIAMSFDPRGFKLMRTTRPFAHVRRSAAGLVGVVLTFATLHLLPLSDATALSFSAPLFIVALALPLLGEQVGRHRWSAVLIGFFGVILVAAPHTMSATHEQGATLGVVLGLLSALFIALSQIALRSLREEPAATSVFYFTLSVTAVSALSLFFGGRWPENWQDGLLLVAIGIIGGCAQLALTESYRYADASMLAPFDYMQIVWALIIGYVVFGEAPIPIGLAGMALIVGAGLYIAFRERRLKRAQATLAAAAAPPPV